MGTSLADDDRYGKLCFVGGGVDPGEDPKYAIARECFEESGIVMFLDPLEIKYNNDNPAVVFGTGRAISGNINHNDEFSDMRWYSKEEVERSNYNNIYEPNIGLLKTFWENKSLNESIEREIKDIVSKVGKEQDLVEPTWKEFTPEVCNDGFCDLFAAEFVKRFPGAKTYSTEESLDKTFGHVWVKYKGKYYDAEIPNGVSNWKDLPYMKKLKEKKGIVPNDIESW